MKTETDYSFKLATGSIKPSNAVFVMWSNGQTDIPGYREEEYFQDGIYLGPDCHGIYPIYSK